MSNLLAGVRRGREIVSDLIRYSTRTLDPHKPQLYLDIHQTHINNIRSQLNARTLRFMLHWIEQAGYEVVIRAALDRRTMTFIRMARWHRNLRFLWGDVHKQNPAVTMTDQANAEGQKCIILHFDYRPDLRVEPPYYVMPYFMHPQLYEKYQADQRVGEYRQTPRKIRVLFVGRFHAEKYDKPVIGKLFGKLTRTKIIQHLIDSDLARIVTTRAELDAVLNGEAVNEMILIDAAKLSIDQGEWLKLIAHADFFLCAPGLDMPMCHNAVESLAVGTIPLINYPEWFIPALVHGESCFAYSTLDDLARQFSEIMALSQDRIAALRECAGQYYDAHLRADDLLKRLLADESPVVHLHVLDETRRNLRETMRKASTNG